MLVRASAGFLVELLRALFVVDWRWPLRRSGCFSWRLAFVSLLCGDVVSLGCHNRSSGRFCSSPPFPAPRFSRVSSPPRPAALRSRPQELLVEFGFLAVVIFDDVASEQALRPFEGALFWAFRVPSPFMW